MSDNTAGSIGIQMILPKTGISPRLPPTQAGGDRDPGDAVVGVDAVVRQAPPPSPSPPPPGMGKLVDRTA
jgi:hypothetical protein